MKTLSIGFILVGLLGSISSFACDFQGKKNDLVKADKIKCNELTKVATIEGPEVEIEGKFYNVGAIYGVEVEYWDTDTRNYNSRNREKVVIEREKKTRIEGRYTSERSQNKICELFGFSRSVQLKPANLYLYWKKAYSFDHDELAPQGIYYAPVSSIKCK